MHWIQKQVCYHTFEGAGGRAQRRPCAIATASTCPEKANVSVAVCAQENASVRVYFDGCNLSVVHVKGHVQVHYLAKSVDLST